MERVILDVSLLAGLVFALVEVAKRTFNISDRFTAITALGLGVLLSIAFLGLSRETALMGLIASLTASGLWGQSKTMLGK